MHRTCNFSRRTIITPIHDTRLHYSAVKERRDEIRADMLNARMPYSGRGELVERSSAPSCPMDRSSVFIARSEALRKDDV